MTDVGEFVLSGMLCRRSRVERLEGVTDNKQPSSVIRRISNSSTLSTPGNSCSMEASLDGACSLCLKVDVSWRIEDEERLEDVLGTGVFNWGCCGSLKSWSSVKSRHSSLLACGLGFFE